MEALMKPVLLGMTTTGQLWPYIHPPLVLGWGPLLLAPRWKYTKPLTLAVPLAHAVLYASVFVPMMIQGPQDGASEPDLGSMQTIFDLFANPDIFFCGWVHYLSFDLLVARGLAMDAIETVGVTNLQYYALVAPCLFGCFYAGPVGYALYMLVRTVLTTLKKKDTIDDDKKTL